jgi:hypothetical protein
MSMQRWWGTGFIRTLRYFRVRRWSSKRTISIYALYLPALYRTRYIKAKHMHGLGYLSLRGLKNVTERRHFREQRHSHQLQRLAFYIYLRLH